MRNYEFLIVGAGITGLTIALELLNKGEKNICVIDKEKNIGAHASGRNSGVLHAGIYYTPDSLKARFCVDGNRMLTRYCDKNSLNINKCGKVIVATDEEQLEELFKLQERAVTNGVGSRIIGPDELKEIEPHAFTYKNAIFSPETSVFDPNEILSCIYSELTDSGDVDILFNTKFMGVNGSSEIRTNEGNIGFKHLVNCSGAFSDKIAHSFGLAEEYKILPFMGTYSKLSGQCSGYVRGNIYPVPDPRTPFLGVHFSRSTNGNVYLGPTAIPAIGRESYNLTSDGSLESFSIIYRDLVMFIRNSAFRDNAISEIRKYLSSYVFEEARKMLPVLRKNDVLKSSKVGIRPQLVNWETKDLVMDFMIFKDGNTTHILNAISPAFTSSMSFAEHVVDDYVLK